MTWRVLMAASVCCLAVGLTMCAVSTVELRRVPFQVFVA